MKNYNNEKEDFSKEEVKLKKEIYINQNQTNTERKLYWRFDQQEEGKVEDFFKYCAFNRKFEFFDDFTSLFIKPFNYSIQNSIPKTFVKSHLPSCQIL